MSIDVERLVRALRAADEMIVAVHPGMATEMLSDDAEKGRRDYAGVLAAEYDKTLPDGERITDARGDELEHGEPDYPGQFVETPRERAAREKRDAG